MASLLFPKFYQFSTDAGAPLNGGKLYFYLTTTTTAKDTFPTEADAEAGTNANTNPIVLDTDGRPSVEVWISGRYRLIVKTSAGVTISDDDPIEDSLPASSAQSGDATYGGDNTGTANALVFAYTPAVSSYTDGQLFRGRILADNSTAVTVNAGGGVKNLVKRDGTALAAGDLQGPDIITFAFDSTSNVMRLQSPDGYLKRDGTNVDTTFTLSGTVIDVSGSTIKGGTPFVFEGATADSFETSLAITDPTADRTVTMPDATGTMLLNGSGGNALLSALTGYSESAETAVTGGAAVVNIAHGLGVVPKFFILALRNKTTELNYAVDDEIILASYGNPGNSNMQLAADATNVTIVTDATLRVCNKSTSTLTAITAGNWKYVVRAWR